MPRRMMYDGRNPYGSRGGYVSSRRPRRDREMYDDEMPRRDMRGRRMDYAEMDMNYPRERHYGGAREYYPVEAMGVFNGYYGMERQDYGRRGGYGDYGSYPEYGDYGETLSEKELDHWCKKLMGHLDEREKQMFSKEAIMPRIKQMGGQMQGYGEHELYVTTLMMYTDYKKTIGQNVDLAIKLAKDWLDDDDVAVTGAEKLAVYYDCIVEGE